MCFYVVIVSGNRVRMAIEEKKRRMYTQVKNFNL
jgi:hypothetical protein